MSDKVEDILSDLWRNSISPKEASAEIRELVMGVIPNDKKILALMSANLELNKMTWVERIAFKKGYCYALAETRTSLNKLFEKEE